MRPDEFSSALNSGLSSEEAANRLALEGANELAQQEHRTLFRIALETIREPMFALLLASAIIYFSLGDLKEGVLLIVMACGVVGIAVVQESRSERVLDTLRDLTSPRALVIRDGERTRIPGREVVRGDVMILAEGDRVPADAIIRQEDDLKADESLLTGEAVPVRKLAEIGTTDTSVAPGGEDLPLVFSGSLIVSGSGIAEVFATGSQSRVGAIGRSLAGIESTTPRLTQETRYVVRGVAIVGVACCAATVLLYGLFRGGWLDAFLAGIALGMSMLPEEFPLVLAVFTVMGAWRLSRARVLTRKAAAIETLGSATILCTDKTGTLTENRMTVTELRTIDGDVHAIHDGAPRLGERGRHLVELGVLASAAEPFDPMEKAFHALHARLSRGKESGDSRTLAKIYPLRPDLLAVTHAWEEPDGDGHLVAVKGAPEAVIALCDLDGERAAYVRRNVDEMAADGLRVLGVAEARHSAGLPESPHGFEFEFLGLIGLSDPLRRNVPESVSECLHAGIRVIVITGDYPQTARAIGARAGLASDNVVTGADIAAMTDADLQEAAQHTSIFARIMPEQKLRLVQALKNSGEIVAMTGDGVNDAPALRAADIGIAMGSRGTDVAREAAQLVLLDDDFSSIVRTVRLGRRIYDNLRKAMGYILAVHVPIAGMALLPLVTGWPLVFAPVHIAFLEMVIDPVCSIVFEGEKEERNIMKRPPRPPQSRLLSVHLVEWGLIQGIAALAVVSGIYFGGVYSELPEGDLRALTFSAIICTNLGLVLVNRSFSIGIFRLFAGANKAFWIVSASAASILFIATNWVPARELFAFGPLHLHDLAILIAAVAGLILILEGLKLLWPSRFMRALTA